MVLVIVQNTPEYRFSVTRIFPYKDIICDSVVIREIRLKENPCSGISCEMTLNPLVPCVH